MPGWFKAARHLGIDTPPSGIPFDGIRFCAGKHRVAAAFRAGHGLGIRRTSLHSHLVKHAQSAGVKLAWGRSIRAADCVSYRWVIAADGAQSGMRRHLGIACRLAKPERFSFRQHFRVAPWSQFVDVHWGDGRQVYLAPVGPDEVGAILITRHAKERVTDALHAFPELACRLRAAETVSTERGALASARVVDKVVSGSVILLGDAAGTVDPITGEGLTASFEQAVALADALQQGDLRLYARAHKRIMRRPRMMGSLMLLLDRIAVAREPVIAGLERWPVVFEKLLAFHCGI